MRGLKTIPGTTAKTGARKVHAGLMQFGIGVHHKRTTCRHRLANWHALHQQNLYFSTALIAHGQLLQGIYPHHFITAHRLIS